MRAFKLAVAAVVLVAAVAYASSVYLRKQDEWNQRVAAETARAEAALAIGDSLRAHATELEGLATSLAFEAEKRDTVIVRMVEELPAPPADCEPFTAPRDSVINQLGLQVEDYREAFFNQRDATDELRKAEILARASADSLLAVLDDRPLPRHPLIPEIGIGATAGVCTTGQPCVAVGLTLSWKVRLF